MPVMDGMQACANIIKYFTSSNEIMDSREDSKVSVSESVPGQDNSKKGGGGSS